MAFIHGVVPMSNMRKLACASLLGVQSDNPWWI